MFNVFNVGSSHEKMQINSLDTATLRPFNLTSSVFLKIENAEEGFKNSLCWNFLFLLLLSIRKFLMLNFVYYHFSILIPFSNKNSLCQRFLLLLLMPFENYSFRFFLLTFAIFSDHRFAGFPTMIIIIIVNNNIIILGLKGTVLREKLFSWGLGVMV